MKQMLLSDSVFFQPSTQVKHLAYVFIFSAGLMAVFGFAPFHLPGMTILSLAFLYSTLHHCSPKSGLFLGFLFGIGYFGFGISWVLNSIHDFGNLNYLLSGLITLLFVGYLALFPALVCYAFKQLASTQRPILNMILFASLWCFGEYLRSTLWGGFPWLLIGTSQIDTPLKYLFPLLGIYGVGILCALTSALLASVFLEQSTKRYLYLIALTLILISPTLLKNIQWTTLKQEPVTIGAVQANLAMRDKWDEALFWRLLKYYERAIGQLLGKQLIILPESAIPLPASYLDDYLQRLDNKALKANSALVLGILQASNHDETQYYNAIISLGTANGQHIKQHLVPFGEYIPRPFVAINRWLNLPEPNIIPSKKEPLLIKIANHSIASLICYEIAFPNLLRQQLPLGEWIVSISDNGWFGHSFASYQQVQMAQVLSLLTGRYQIVVNNDGLSSVINQKGTIVEGLAPYSRGTLESEVYPAEGATPWVLWSNYPSLFFCSIALLLAFIFRLREFLQQ